jgi:AcrR family transcriptional regulator
MFLEVFMSPRPDVSEERKSQILDAAISVFARLGFHQARMDDIAQEAGLSKGALYLYYKSKDTIIAAILKYLFTQEMKALHAFVAAEQHGSVRAQLEQLTQQLAEAMNWMSRLMPIAFEFYAIAGRQKDVHLFLQEYFKEYRADLARLIQRGIDQGEFRAVDPQATAITLTALYEGLALLFFVDPQAVQWNEQLIASTRLLLDGLASHDTRQSPIH